jgi:hypothetical protein
MLAVLFAGAVFADSAVALADKVEVEQAATQAPSIARTATTPPRTHKSSPYRPGVPNSSKVFYQAAWGVDNMLVRQMASGNLIRFSYRVTDPARSKVLGDKLATPVMYGQRSRALLHIPVMDKVGQLRQSGAAEAGREYWMVFSNKGNLVKPGDRVDVVIGSFHADGLMVE